MKTTFTKTILRTLVLAGCMLLTVLPQAQAQCCASQRKVHFAIDWQMNAPLSTDFADKISGWGMNLEGAYDVTPNFSVGAFVSFHTNHRYVGRQTLHLSPTESLTTDQQRSAFQVPFGIAGAYTFCNGSHVRPYVGVKLGYHVRPEYDLFRHRRSLRQELGLLCIAGNRPENLSEPGKELGIPRSRLLQLCHQPHRDADGRHRRTRQRRFPPRYPVLMTSLSAV